MIRGSLRLLFGAAVLAACVGIAACSAVEPDTSRSESGLPRPTTSLHDRAEAVAAAERVYAAYVRISSEVSRRHGAGVERLKPYLSADAYATEQKSILKIAAAGLGTVGVPKLLNFKPQTVDLSAGSVSAYACVDFSGVVVKNAAGKDVTPEDRVSRQTSVPTFTTQNGRLVLVKDGSWSGDSIC